MAHKAITPLSAKRGMKGRIFAKLGHCGDWWPDEDDWDEWIEPLAVGAVEVAGSIDESASPPVLWVPDPEQYHGWREFYCHEDEPERASIGFAY